MTDETSGGDAVAEVGRIRRVTHTGVLRIGDMSIPCGVLEDGTRVLSERAVLRSLGLYSSSWTVRSGLDDGGAAGLPQFVGHKNLRPYIDNDLAVVLREPIWYSPLHGGRASKGVDARVIPQVCEVWLRARDAEVLGKRQEQVAARADLLIRSLAHVGIIALVDEATGYQRDRAKDALTRILELYISKELAKYARTFPDEFYLHLFRLRGWTVSDLSKRPGYTAQLTNDIVYARLAPKVLEELKRVQVRGETGRPKHPLYARLTPDWGHPKLKEHLAAVVALMKVSENWGAFQRLLNRALPRQDVPELLAGEGYQPESADAAPPPAAKRLTAKKERAAGDGTETVEQTEML